MLLSSSNILVYSAIFRLRAPYSEHAPIRFRAWGTAPQKILKLRRSGVPEFLICAFFLLKDPDTQITCNTPKIWPHFGCNKHIFRQFRLFSSLLCLKKSWCVVPRYRKGPGINKSFRRVEVEHRTHSWIGIQQTLAGMLRGGTPFGGRVLRTA